MYVLAYLNKNIEAECPSFRGSPREVKGLFGWWLNKIMFHFEDCADLKALWIVECIAKRLSKRLILSFPYARDAFEKKVDLAKFYFPETILAANCICPANFLIEAVEKSSFSIMSDFLTKCYESNKIKFKLEYAKQYIRDLEKLEFEIKNITPNYEDLKNELGNEWGELMSYDDLNTDEYDPLIQGALSVLSHYPNLIQQLTAKQIKQLTLFKNWVR